MFTFRSYTPEDIPFIQNSWGISYKHSWHHYQVLGAEAFHSYHRPLRERILSRPNATAIVACAKDDPDHILAWVVVELPTDDRSIILHYLYVKHPYRGEGLGLDLLKRSGCLQNQHVLFTHLTPQFRTYLKANDLKNFHHFPHLV